MAGSQSEIRLPLVGRSLVFEPLPGQDLSKRYGAIWDVCDQPGDGLGYVVEFTEPRTCRILAWMGSGGMVIECDRPLTFVMPGIPAVAVIRSDDEGDSGMVRVRRHGSDELVETVGFRDQFPNQVLFAPLKGKRAEGIASQRALADAIGVYAGRKLGWRTFTALSYLAFYLLPRLGAGRPQATGNIGDVLATFVEQPLPDAVEGLVFRVVTAEGNPDDQVSGFERYAARMLEQAGASNLRSIAAKHPIVVARLSTTHLFWIRIADDLDEDERRTLLGVEACMNRLALVELALKSQGASAALRTCREGTCAIEDQKSLAQIADNARALVDGGQEDNPYCTFIPAAPERGGEWDVRTRFIRACEGLPAPYRLEYRFDCHAAAGVLHVVFGLPDVSAFPATRWNAAASRWENRADERPAFAACYVLRMAAAVAACGFGAGIGMRQVVVEGRRGGISGDPLVSLRFERMSFLNRTVNRIDIGAVARIGERGACTADDVSALLDTLAPLEASMSFDAAGGLTPVEPLSADIPESRIPLSADTRFLPPTLAHLMHADRVCDMDIEGQNDLRQLDAVQTAIEDAADSPLLAMARLEEIAANAPVEGLEAQYEPPGAGERPSSIDLRPGYREFDEEGQSRPVRLAYFPSLASRCLVDMVATRDDEAFEAVPDHVYVSRAALSKLYMEDGDTRAALARSAECAALAPTSEGALIEAAQVHLSAKREDDAIELLKRALRVCVRQSVANVIYAHLAGAYWAKGEAREALACFMMARRNAGGQATGLDTVIGELVKQLGLDGMPTFEEAQAMLRALGIPLAPTDEVRAMLMTAAVGFTDARMFELAWPLVGIVGMDAGNDVLSYLGEMLHTGIPPVQARWGA